MRAAIGCLIAISAIAFTPPPAALFALKTDFFQVSNLGPPLGNIDWIQSILQQSNSIYAEGMSVPQRLVFLEIPDTAGNVHTVEFQHQATKGGDVHAYDFLTSWDQAIQAGKGKGPGDANLLDELADVTVIVQAGSSQSATLAQMQSLWFPANNPVVVEGDIIPDAMPSVGGGTGDVAAQITAYEANPLFGNRTVTVRAPNGNPVSNVQCEFVGYSPSGADFYANYELSWTSDSDVIGIEFAGHLGVGTPDGIVPGYGAGFGSSNINGGPYHFKMGGLDGSGGSIDNQIKGADIIIDAPECVVNGPDTACQGDTSLQFQNGEPFDPTITYAWALINNTSGASFCSATNTNVVCVNAGGSAGSFEIELSKTNAGGTTTCSKVVTVNATTTTTDPPNQTVCTGTSVSFTTVTSGTGPFTYSWTKDGAPIAGETTATLNLGVVDETDEAEYCVTVVGTCGSDTECATLVVNPATSTTDPPDQTVCAGTNVTFTTVASGTGPFTYAWTFNGNPIGGNSPSLPLGPVDASDEGTYCVTVTGTCGPPVEQCAELVISAGTSTTEPPDQEVCPGDSVSFTTTPSGTGPFTFVWTFEGAPIGGNTATLNLGPVDESDEGTYCVTVFGSCGPSAPQCAELVVNANTTATDPPDQEVCSGASVTFTTTAGGTGPFTYAWTFEGAPIGGNSPSLPLGVVDENDEGTYCVTVTGECGPPVQRCAELVVNDATSTTDPPDQTVCTGASVTFTTVASGTGPFTYAWTFEGAPIGGNSPSLPLGVVDASDEGTYCVTVTGACGPPVQQCAELVIKDGTTTTDPPDQEVCQGEEVTFTTSASGTGPFTYAWTFEGAPIGGNSPSLPLGPVDESDEGTYCVSVTGACGPPAQQCAELVVNEPVRTQDLADVEVCPGEPVSFTVIVTGTGPFSFAWTKSSDPGVVLSTTDTLSIPSRTLEDSGEYCVTVTGGCGLPAVECVDLTVMVCDEVFCTFTQGFWGNANGKFNGQNKQQLLTEPPYDLMATDLTVGVTGERSLTIPSASWECIIIRLPAGGTPTTLPDFGDQTMGGAPGCSVPGLPLKNGKFQNVFLGQVITLSLNVRLDPELVDLELCNLMTTLAVDPGPDGLMHTDDDSPIPGTEKVVFISPVIMNALDNLGLDQTVGGLLELANQALAGMPTGGASISAINGAVDAINNGFDGCRLMTSCETL